MVPDCSANVHLSDLNFLYWGADSSYDILLAITHTGIGLPMRHQRRAAQYRNVDTLSADEAVNRRQCGPVNYATVANRFNRATAAVTVTGRTSPSAEFTVVPHDDHTRMVIPVSSSLWSS